MALDASKSLLDAAAALARDGKLIVDCPTTRGSSVTQVVHLDADADPTQIVFQQCNPMCLPAALAGELLC